MTLPFVVEKYVKQIKAMNPKYDKPYEVSKADRSASGTDLSSFGGLLRGTCTRRG